MFCAISGEVPSDPVVSRKTGHLFEKRLVEQFLSSEDKCPVTGEPLTVDDLLPVQATQTTKPRPITATSIPGLLSHFQNEWDTVMLETYTLKQHLDNTRKELSQVLYQHDAACRVIARLTRELNEARSMLSQRQGQMAEEAAAVVAGESMEVEQSAVLAEITDDDLNKMITKGAQLSQGRKRRPIAPNLASAQDLSESVVLATATPHSSVKQGITCIDMHPGSVDTTLSGGMDKNAIIFDHANNKVLATLTGHTKKLTACKFHPDASKAVVITASADKLTKIWSADASRSVYSEAFTLDSHQAEVTDMSVHPTGEYLATVGRDNAWCFHSIDRGLTLKRVVCQGDNAGLSCVQFHPDGLILGTGTEDSMVRIWDMKSQKLVHSFEGHKDAVHDLSFSENGYYMASVAGDATCRLWDLRKLKNVKTLQLSSPGLAVSFDHSGTYLAAATGNSVKINLVKEWTEVTTLQGHTKDVTSLSISKDASRIYTASMDRSIKSWGKKSV